MAMRRYIVQSSVATTYDMLLSSQHNQAIIFEELRHFGSEKEFATIACEQVYFKTSKTVLFITIHNWTGVTEVTAISTSSSATLLGKLNWQTTLLLNKVTKTLKPVTMSYSARKL